MATYTHNEVAGSPTNYWGDQDVTYVSATSGLVILNNTDGTQTRLFSSGNDFTFTGSGSSIVLTGGTITSARHTNSAGTTIYETIGGSYAATAFQSHIPDANLNGVMQDVFANNDTFNGFSGDDIMKGFNGTDVFNSSAGNDSYDGGSGIDIASYVSASITGPITVNMSSTSTVVGNASVGTDTLVSVERVRGTSFADTFTADTSYSGSNGAFNAFEGGAGNDTITGNGSTRAEYALAAAAVTVHLLGSAGTGTAQSTAAGDAAGIGVDTLINVNQVLGSAFNDTLSAAGGQGRFTFLTSSGDDTVTGGTHGVSVLDLNTAAYNSTAVTAGVSVSAHANGTTTVSGDASVGTDTLIGVERVRGTDFSDTYNAAVGFTAEFGVLNDFEGMGGNDTITGNGSTRLIFSSASAAVTVDFTTGTSKSSAAGDPAGVGIDNFTGVNGVVGSIFDDTLIGNAQNQQFNGGAGNDTINGGGGALDRVTYGDSPTGVVVNLATGIASDGFGTTDSISNVAGVSGSAFNDTIIGDNNDNRLAGGYGDDIINGGGGNDIISGGSGALLWNGIYGSSAIRGSGNDGNDTLTGGAGDDTFIFGPGGAADVITDFTAGAGTVDKIDLSGFATLHTLGQVLSLATQVGNDHGGNDTIIDFGSGDTLRLQDVAKGALSVDDFVGLTLTPTSNDFNGDRTSDLLLRNDSGAVRADIISGAQFDSSATVGQLGLEWQVKGTGDFNGDGTTDILWRNSNTGDVRADLIKDGHYQSTAIVGQLGIEWQVQGTGDFNGDGTSDILWRNSNTGDVRADLIKDGHYQSTAIVGQLGLEWQVVGTGDFNKDGTSDVLWRNSNTGDVRADLIKDGHYQSSATVGQLGLEWKVAGTGDFNNDGTTDILWRNSNTGDLRADLIQNGQYQSSAVVGQLGLEWQVVRTGDYNHDGTDDVLWHNVNTNDVRIDLIQNGHYQSTSIIEQLTPDWHLL